MKRFLFLIIIHSLSIALFALDNTNIDSSLKEELSIPYSLILQKNDSIEINSIKFYFSIYNNTNLNNTIINDINKTSKLKAFKGAEIKYEINQYSNNFLSITRHVYVERLGIARGYEAWDECVNIYKYNDCFYEVVLTLKKNIKELIASSIESSLLDIDKQCLKEDILEPYDFQFLFKNGKLFLHNPILYPVCNFDLILDLNKDVNIEFRKAKRLK